MSSYWIDALLSIEWFLISVASMCVFSAFAIIFISMVLWLEDYHTTPRWQMTLCGLLLAAVIMSIVLLFIVLLIPEASVMRGL